MPCITNRCRSGRVPCPTPIACGVIWPDTKPRQDLGEDESGPMERLERSDWASAAAGMIKGVVTILVLLLALFAGGELRDWHREHQQTAGSKG